MKNYYLTLDYELFGNGSGDIFEHIIEPTKKLLEVCRKYDAKITIFCEVIEYLKIKEEWNKGNVMGYASNPAKAIEDQLKEAIAEGHDVQLHIHPQWMDAVYTKNGWEVNDAEWILGSYEGGKKESIYEMLKLAQSSLNELLKPVNSLYECVALRAGGYNVMPSENVAGSMRKLGLRIDTSVYTGGFQDSSFSKYDYSQVKNDKGKWHAEDDFRKISDKETGLLELPIFALPSRRISKILNLTKLNILFKNKSGSKRTASKVGSKNSHFSKLKYLFGKEAQTWDFCILPVRIQKKFIAQSNYFYKNNNRKDFVLIGHSKGFTDERPLVYLLEKEKGKANFITISSILNSN